MIPAAILIVELHRLRDLDHVTEVLGEVQMFVDADDTMCHFILDFLLVLVESLLNLNERLQLNFSIDFRI